jgi:hypothetical protein
MYGLKVEEQSNDASSMYIGLPDVSSELKRFGFSIFGKRSS